MPLRFDKNNIVGFTLIELIIIIVLLGILSVSALPKFLNTSSFSERALFDDTLNALRYAQKLARATRCEVRVSFASNAYQLNRPASLAQCGSGSITYSTNVPHPGSGASNYTGSETGVTLSSTAANIVFNSIGSASTAATVTVGSRTLAVIQETGFSYAL